MNMTQFKTPTEYPVELTPARRHLAELIAKRDEAGKESDVLQVRIARLVRAQDDVRKIESELTALGIQESAEMLSWVQRDDGTPAPAGFASRRADLESKLATARAAARAGDAATASLSSQVTRVNTGLANLSVPLSLAAAAVVAEEMTPLLDDMRAAVAEIERCKSKINAGRDYLIAAGQSLANGTGSPILMELEKFDLDARNAGSALPTDHAAHAAAFASLGARLRSDPTATLEATS
jgi:hypothetical protein